LPEPEQPALPPGLEDQPETIDYGLHRSEVRDDGLLEAVTDHRATIPLAVDGASFHVKAPGDPTVPPRVAYPLGPDLVKSQHFEENETNIAAAVHGRIGGKAQPFKPSATMRRKIKACVTQYKHTIYTREKIMEWAATHTCLSDLVSKKWTAEMTRHAVDELLNWGVGSERQNWLAKVKDEILPDRGKAPRLVLDAQPEGQLLSLVVVKCFEDLLFDHFKEESIKHKPRHDAVMGIFKKLNGEKRGRLIEGDGSAWDTTVGPELRHLLEDELLQRVAEILFEHLDVGETVHTWVRAGLDDRAKMKRLVMYKKKKAFGVLILRAFRASGDRGTSALNYLVNATLWACILLDDPAAWIREPSRKWYRMRNGEWILHICAYEGDDSVLRTTSRMTDTAIELEWKSLGFRMKLDVRRPGDALIFVGMCSYVMEDGSVAPVAVPEPNRNIAAAAWSLSDVPSFTKAVSLAARASTFGAYPPLANYFGAIGRHWLAQTGTFFPISQGRMDRDTQMFLFGDYRPDAMVTFEDILGRRPEGWPGDQEMMPFGRAAIEAYVRMKGGAQGVPLSECRALSPAQEAVMMGLDKLGPGSEQVVVPLIPGGLLC
jgi:hypothetical protein